MDDPHADHSTGDALPPSQIDDRPITSMQIQDAAPGICRICRGEGTSAEPLFYPCKCSGSIKYVHQDCLMEWLSHSQKKYCELCKTSFRFTKLYAPDMPQSLPVHIFLEHMAKYFFRNALVWLRAVVAISIWICWLPYFMRAVWSFMFWVSDDGLVSGSLLSRANGTVELSSTMLGMATCPSSPLFAPTVTPAAAAEAMLGSSQRLSIFEFIFRFAVASLPGSIRSNTTNSDFIRLATTTPPSLLSDVTLIRNLAGNSTLHRTVVWIFEGQMITVLVILSFILVILVRDYVVQQQPEINMRAAFAVPENPLPPQEQPDAEPEPANVQVPERPEEPDSDDETLDDGDQARGADWANGPVTAGEVADQQQPTSVAQTSGETAWRELPPIAGDDSRQALPLGDRHPGSTEEPSVVEFLRIYRQADGDPEEILHIAEEEGLQDKLNYWMDVTRRSLKDRNGTDGNDVAGPAPTDDNRPPSSGSGAESSNVAFTPSSSERSQVDASDLQASTGEPKGKEREWLPTPSNTDSQPSQPSEPLASRPRAMSDGPQPQQNINPLANGTWSFADLSPHDADDSQLRQHPTAQGGWPSSGLSPDDAREFQSLLAAARKPKPPHQSTTPPSSTIAEVGSPSGVEHMGSPGRNLDAAEDLPQDTANEHVIHDAQIVEHGSVEEPIAPGEVGPVGIVDRVTNFMWGDLDEPPHHDPVDEALMEDDHDDIWVDEPEDEANLDDEDLDGVAAGGDFDAEAMDDMDDFDGVMELVGMRGPLAGLFQNAIFCAVLVTVTIFACVFLPYNIGRVSVWILANPIRLVRMLFEVSKFVQDVAVMVGGLGSWCALNLVDMITGVLGGLVADQIILARKASWGIWTTAGSRVVEYLFMGFPMSASEMQNFSAISHDALLTVKGQLSAVISAVDTGFGLVFRGGFPDRNHMAAIASGLAVASDKVVALSSLLLNPGSWVIDLSEAESFTTIDPELAHWSGLDRFWAILAGYITIFFIGAMYLKRGTPFSRGSMMQDWEAGVIDTLHQASGIIKVILIISIEMLVFPLYCGLLLDAALLPLFEDTTFKSRMLFTYNYPLTSVFVHWFVGTGYMFHFALFVSMCRKIMRPGVLYFIRDPDDPEFHPVRDVLERNLMTQLRKILFSAFVYGALVIVCLGGVVWGLSYTVPNVLPIHYSSNEPVLEFPVDLLFYNFLMPLAVKFFKPSDGLHAMYTWWFRKCARGLRLTYFLFGERRIDEEGTMQLAPDSRHNNDHAIKTLLLELNEDNEVVPKTWRDTFEGGDAKPNPPLPGTEMRALRHKKGHLVDSGQLVKSGRFVRAPASDRVKIPKGKKVFLTVTERDHRKDDRPDDDLYASNQYQVVYIPPHFRARIFLFILFIWMFAAVTGVGFTIVPLVFGRRMFKELIPEHIRTNDIYAFSIGIYLLGSIAYSVFHVRHIWGKVRGLAAMAREQVLDGQAAGHVTSICIHGAKLVYAYFFLLVVFPLLLSALLELYLAIPLHTWLHPPTVASVASAQAASDAVNASQHTVRVIQSWTLGLLYLKLGARGITSYFPDSRPAIAVRTVLHRGWLRPDVGVLTRGFIMPGLAIAAAGIFGPPMMTTMLSKYGVFDSGLPVANEAAEALRMAMIYRKSYPVAALSALVVRNAVRMVKVFNGWTARIRDEAYLIGERLHNFGAGPTSGKKTRAAWRAGGPRL